MIILSIQIVWIFLPSNDSNKFNPENIGSGLTLTQRLETKEPFPNHLES